MTLAPINPPYLRSAPQWSAQVGAGSLASGRNAIGGNVTLTPTNAPRLLVIFYQIQGFTAFNGGAATAGRLTGLRCTQGANFRPLTRFADIAAESTMDYIFTLPISNSLQLGFGSVNIQPEQTLSSAFGSSSWRAFELSGYTNPVPEVVVSSDQVGSPPFWTVNTSSNIAAGGLLRGLGEIQPNGTISPDREPFSVEPTPVRPNRQFLQELQTRPVALQDPQAFGQLRAYMTFVHTFPERGPIRYVSGQNRAGETANYLYAAWR